MEQIILNLSPEKIILILTSIITIASIIAKLTPTEVDDKIVGKILKVIDFLAINNKPTVIKKK